LAEKKKIFLLGITKQFHTYTHKEILDEGGFLQRKSIKK
jgi:hypothetical protein